MSHRRIKLNAATIPAIGTIYSVPLDETRFGGCAVLARKTPEMAQSAHERDFAAFVAVLDWVGRHPIALEQALAAAIVHRPTRVIEVVNGVAQSAMKDAACGVWVGQPPPAEFQVIGVLNAVPAFREPLPQSWSNWPWLVSRIRDQLITVDEADQPATTAVAGTAAAAHPAKSKEDPLQDWRGHVDPALLRATQAILDELSRETSALPVRASRAKKLEPLQRAVERLNMLNDATPFITTLEREDLCERLGDIAEGSGLQDVEALIDQWRTW